MVGGIGIMNVMLVSVSERTREVGLLKALGAAERQILALFLTEALLLAGAGTALGLVLAFAGLYLFNGQIDAFQLVVPLWAPVAAVTVSLVTGLVFGLLPALRAARLDPIGSQRAYRRRRSGRRLSDPCFHAHHENDQVGRDLNVFSR